MNLRCLVNKGLSVGIGRTYWSSQLNTNCQLTPTFCFFLSFCSSWASMPWELQDTGRAASPSLVSEPLYVCFASPRNTGLTQKFVFSLRCYLKTRINFLANPIYCHLWFISFFFFLLHYNFCFMRKKNFICAFILSYLIGNSFFFNMSYKIVSFPFFGRTALFWNDSLPPLFLLNTSFYCEIIVILGGSWDFFFKLSPECI